MVRERLAVSGEWGSIGVCVKEKERRERGTIGRSRARVFGRNRVSVDLKTLELK